MTPTSKRRQDAAAPDTAGPTGPGAAVCHPQPGTQPATRPGYPPSPAVAPAAQPDLTDEQIQQAIAFNRTRYNAANTRLIQSLLGGPVTGEWNEENIQAIAANQEIYGLKRKTAKWVMKPSVS